METRLARYRAAAPPPSATGLSPVETRLARYRPAAAPPSATGLAPVETRLACYRRPAAAPPSATGLAPVETRLARYRPAAAPPSATGLAPVETRLARYSPAADPPRLPRAETQHILYNGGMEPLYTSENCSVAYQLNWSLSLFLQGSLPPVADWLGPLRAATEPDGVRILESIQPRPEVLQFFVSSLPPIAPCQIIHSVKSRLQYLVRDRHPKAFYRNYRIESVGSSNNESLDAYLAKQPERHRMADPRVQERIAAIQFHDAGTDLTVIRRSGHGEFLFNLQVVLENADGWNETSEAMLTATRDMIVNSCRHKGQLLSRAAILANHIHVTVGCGIEDSPQSVGLSMLNNLAYVQGMRPVFKFSYYVGTFGNFDRYAIWRKLR